MEVIDLKDLLKAILKRWWIVACLTVVATILGSVYSYFVVKPVYQSDTSIYIGKNSDAQSSTIMYNDVLVNDRLVNDYREIVKSRLIANQVIKELGIKNMTEAQFAQKLSVSSKKDTRLIVISATDNNPEFAQKMVDKVAEVFQKKAESIMKVENIQIIDKATVPVSPVKPNKKKNIAFSFIVGFIIGIGIVLVINYFDDTIKTPEDIKKYIDVPVIGTIPIFPE